MSLQLSQPREEEDLELSVFEDPRILVSVRLPQAAATAIDNLFGGYL